MRIIVFIVSFLFCCSFGLKANDTLTIREAFNWKVGDTLIYKTYGCGTFQVGPGGPFIYSCTYSISSYGFTIISRINSVDSITYVISWHDGNSDTLFVTDLDADVSVVGYLNFYTKLFNRIGNCYGFSGLPSCNDTSNTLIFPCQINYYEDTMFNLLMVDITMNLFESGYDVSYAEKIGLKEIWYGAGEFFNGMSGGCGITLVYYKSDSTMWVDSSLLYTGINDFKTDKVDFSIYPNPTNNNFTVTLPPATKQIIITNTIGQVVQTHETGKEEKQLQISLRESGTYFVHVTTSNATVTKKVICIAGFK